ncbi:hypothetical protein [Bradyrhizobium erythrophlei]|uniref:hypothetical protein n=1 Tax=Bradyrhizobium erythrophlei TaxID=1437360 RepID=UPI003CC7DDFA
MANALHIVCPHCETIDRMPRKRLRDGAKCGSCHRPLYEGKPVALARRASTNMRTIAMCRVGRFLGRLVRTLRGDGADLRAGRAAARTRGTACQGEQ